ncbi:hypothetical protein [Nocardiopsis trehalosi]|uniref:hypothetical protein n=1 Tax=Nocardiopsis trehalosi TaxID=109329 RepID=UPI0008339561|nr:hypothetical protein [Nocardiopsis trehalosi]
MTTATSGQPSAAPVPHARATARADASSVRRQEGSPRHGTVTAARQDDAPGVRAPLSVVRIPRPRPRGGGPGAAVTVGPPRSRPGRRGSADGR